MADLERFEEAVRLFKDSDLKRTEICRALQIDYNAFSYFLKNNHPDLLTPRGSKRNSQSAIAQRRETAKTYRYALRLCEATDLSFKEIAEITGVSLSGLKTFIQKHHRQLLLRRNGLEAASQRLADRIRLRSREAGQSLPGYEKYKDAIEACKDDDLLPLTVSQIAESFGLTASGLLAQLRDHFPELSADRERKRLEAGYADNRQRGVRKISSEQYAAAVKELRETEKTLAEVADECNVSMNGLKSHLLSYHKDVVAIRRKRQKEREAMNKENIKAASSIGDSTGFDVNEKYAEAVEVLKAGEGSVESVAKEFGYLPATFRDYLKRHQPELFAKFGRKTGENGRQVLARSAEKYGPAIEAWKNTGRTLKDIAAEFGHPYSSFSKFVKRNY